MPGDVSIIIPAYRCAATIGQVLSALLKQTVKPARIVVVNDNSPDHLNDVLEAYKSHIEVMVNPHNMGLAKSYNRGLRTIETAYAMTVHSDCVLEPDYIERLLAVLESDSSAGVATGQYLFPEVDQMSFTDRLYLALNFIPRDVDGTGVQPISFIEGKADVFRTSCLKAVGYFSEDFILTAEDQDLSIRFRQHGWTLMQDTNARFVSAFGGTQDQVWKVIRKQRTYARGQAMILWKHGRNAYQTSTTNRNRRARHRLFQLLCAAVECVLLVGGFFCPIVWGILLAICLLRFGWYAHACFWVGWRDILLVAALGVWSDVWYTVGFLEGLLKYGIRKKA